MTRELIIEGQHVDLAPDTDIIFEYSGNIVGEVGKISLAHSYTARLPKTARNARILDDPGNASRESSMTRRFLSARYYRNGIDLLGPAKAYILRTTPEVYEVALVWNSLEALQELSQSKESLNDLPDLPVLPWIGVNGTTPDYVGDTEGGAFFAWYESGLGASHYPDVNAATHPCMYVRSLLDRILTGAGVPYELSDGATDAIGNAVVLAAPGRKPSRGMEIESGSYAGTASTTPSFFGDWHHGWDTPSGAAGIANTFNVGENVTHRVLVNLLAPEDADFSGIYVVIKGIIVIEGIGIIGYKELFREYFKEGPQGWYIFIDEEINLSGWRHYAVDISGTPMPSATFAQYREDLPLLAANRVHKDIVIANDNRFPLEGNLPDIQQWDFVKACMAMFGLSPVIQAGRLVLKTGNELLSKSGAYDWTKKVDMTARAPQDMSYTLDGWAQVNAITFQDDVLLPFDPEARIIVDDTTLSESRDLYALPFAASVQSNAQHYRLKDGAAEEADIKPRVFRLTAGLEGRQLYFSGDLYGEGLASARYPALQRVVRRPLALTEHIRLNEIDLAHLDITRPVYLGQYGRYFVITRIQTSGTDLCKVELLQIP